MSRLWAVVAAAWFSSVPDEPLARIEWTERPRTSPAPWQALPGAGANLGVVQPAPPRPGVPRPPGRRVARPVRPWSRRRRGGSRSPGWEMWRSAVCARRNSARRRPPPACSRGCSEPDAIEIIKTPPAHLGRARSASVSPEFCAASCSTVSLPASLVDKVAAAAASVLRSVCR